MKLNEVLNTIKSCADKVNTDVYICGGTPRDKVLKRLTQISDIDITTCNSKINDLAKLTHNEFSKDHKVILKSSKDGHHTIYFKNIKIDFSSNYNEPNISNILKDKNIQDTEFNREVYSRDFTCNSLLLSITLDKIIDPINGVKDIDNKIIKTNLDPSITFANNKNRVVRAVYLACHLGFDIDQSIIDYVKSNPKIASNSTEHTASEKLNKAFNKNPDKAAKLITEMNIWNYIPITPIMQKYYLRQEVIQ